MTRGHSEQPNIVVFLTDQQRWDTTGAHDNPLGLTPNFDRMARHGTNLVHTFTPHPVCTPARATLQTGRYGTSHQCIRNAVPLPSGTSTLAHEFRSAGYTTGYIGKWHLAGHATGPVAEQERGGYQYWLASNRIEWTSDSYRTIVYDNAGQPVLLPGYRTDALTDAAIRFIGAHQDEPFYLFLSVPEPHQQNYLDDFPPPDGYRERYSGVWMPPDLASLGGSAHQHLSGYYGMVKRIDEALGRLLDALKSLDLSDNTIVLFTSDHGCHFKTRNQFADGYKRSCHDSSIRVPAAITGPGFNGGRQVREVVSLIDLPPTLLDAAGLPIPPEMQGHSICSLLKGEQHCWPEEVLIQVSEAEVGRAIRTHRWKYGVTAPGTDPRLDAGSDHYVESHLYDLMADPYELTNLVGIEAYQEVVNDLRLRLAKLMVDAGEPAPHIESAPVLTNPRRRVSLDLPLPAPAVDAIASQRNLA